MTLPRTTEALVRGRVKFRVGRIVYVAFSRDETMMGFGFPRTSEVLVADRAREVPDAARSDLRYHWVVVRLAAIDPEEMRDMVFDAWAMGVPKSVSARLRRAHVTVLDLETPQHGRVFIHLHPAQNAKGALVLGHGAGGGVAARDLVAVAEVAGGEGFGVALVEPPCVCGTALAFPARAGRRVDRRARSCCAGELGGLPMIIGAAPPAPGSPAARRRTPARPACSAWRSRSSHPRARAARARRAARASSTP